VSPLLVLFLDAANSEKPERKETGIREVISTAHSEVIRGIRVLFEREIR